VAVAEHAVGLLTTLYREEIVDSMLAINSMIHGRAATIMEMVEEEVVDHLPVVVVEVDVVEAVGKRRKGMQTVLLYKTGLSLGKSSKSNQLRTNASRSPPGRISLKLLNAPADAPRIITIIPSKVKSKQSSRQGQN